MSVEFQGMKMRTSFEACHAGYATQFRMIVCIFYHLGHATNRFMLRMGDGRFSKTRVGFLSNLS